VRNCGVWHVGAGRWRARGCKETCVWCVVAGRAWKSIKKP